jgi:hypothetical protein
MSSLKSVDQIIISIYVYMYVVNVNLDVSLDAVFSLNWSPQSEL